MKKLLITAVAATCMLLAACASTTGTTAAAPPAQVAGQICPIATAVIADLSSPLAPLTAGEKAAVAAAAPVVTTACSLGASIDAGNYQSLLQAVPQLIAAFEGSNTLSQQAQSNLFLLQVAFSAIAAGQAGAPPAPTVAAPPPAK